MAKLTFNTLSNNTVNNNNEVKPMIINLDLIRVRKANESMITNAIKTMNKLNNQLAVLTTKISELQQFKVVSNTKARRLSDSPKAVVKQPKVRKPGSVKPARITVAHKPLVASKSLRSFGACGVSTRPSNDIKLTTLIPNKFFMEAKSMLDNTKNNLPQVAQSMTMMMEDIDAEFGINNTAQPEGTTNNPQEDESMTTSNEALNLINNMPKLESTKSTTSINFDDMEGLEGETFTQTTDGSAVINNPKGLPMESITIDGFKTFGNPNAKTSVTLFFNVEHRLININTPISAVAKQFNQRLIEVYQFVIPGFPEVTSAKFKTYDTANVADFIALVKLVHQSLKACDTVVEAQDLFSGLIGTMFMDQWESKEHDTTQYSTAAIVEQQGNVVDAQAVARLNKVVAFHRDENRNILIKSGRRIGRTNRTLLDEQGNPSEQGTKGSPSSWVSAQVRNDKGELVTKDCLEVAMETWGFCLSDKTNTKYAYCLDAVQAIGGVSYDGLKSLVVADKEGKALARHSMSAHISAKFPGSVARDGLLSEMSEGRFAAHYGKDLQASYIVDTTITSLLMGDGGMVLNTPITANINKKLVANFNLTTSTLTEDEARVAVLAELQKLESLTPGQVVEFDGQVLLQYCGNLEVNVVKVAVAKTVAANTEVVGLEFNLQVEATITDSNWKLRGQWLKGMTAKYSNFKLLTSKGGAQLPTDLVFNANSVKNKKAMLLRMWANYNNLKVAFCKDGAIRLLKSDTKGNLVKAGEINAKGIQKGIDKMVKDAYVSFQANHVTVARHQEASPEAFESLTVSAPDANGLCTIEGTVKVINAPLVVAVELSSVAENLSVGRGVAPITTKLLTTFTDANEVVINTVRKHSNRVAKMVEASTSKEVAKTLDLHKDSLELDEVLAIVVAAPSAYIAFEGLKNKFPNGLQITGNVGKSSRGAMRPWSVNLYTQLLFSNGKFNKSGWSHDTKINNVYSFLKLIAQGNRDVKTLNTIADFAYAVGYGLDMWREDVVSGKGTLTKTNACLTHHGMKVIANAEAGYELHEGHQVPVILLSEANPLVQTIAKRKAVALDKNGRNVKPLADGDVVLFHRNPLVDLMPAIIRVVGEDVVGPYVAAISPDAFALANCGDFDGDSIWLIPGYQMGTRKVLKPTDAKYMPSAKLTALMTHPLVGGKISNKAMYVYAGSNNILSGILETKDVTNLTTTEKLAVSPGVSISYELGLIADRTEQLYDARTQQANPELTIGKLWCQGAEATANHYRIRVGQGYSIMFNAINTYIDEYHSGNPIRDDRRIYAVKAASLYIYEHIGLAGYSYESEQSFKRLYDFGKGLLGLSKHTVIKTHFNGGHRAPYRESVGRATDLSTMAVVDYFAMTIVQSSINRKNSNTQKSGNLYRSAIKAAVMRSLTKGLFNSTKGVDAGLLAGFVNPSDPYATLLDTVVTAARHRV